MFTQTKVFVTLALVSVFGLSQTFAADVGSGTTDVTPVAAQASATKFSMLDVQVVDSRTLEATFSNELLADNTSEVGDFALTLASDDTKEIKVKSVELATPTSVKITLDEDLTVATEYNLLAQFVSDKNAQIIESGEDGLVTFKTPDTLTPATQSQDVAVDANGSQVTEPTPTDGAPAEDMNAASELDATAPATPEVAPAQPVEQVAPNALPKTGTPENILILVSLLVGLGLFALRRKSA